MISMVWRIINIAKLRFSLEYANWTVHNNE